MHVNKLRNKYTTTKSDINWWHTARIQLVLGVLKKHELVQMKILMAVQKITIDHKGSGMKVMQTEKSKPEERMSTVNINRQFVSNHNI